MVAPVVRGKPAEKIDSTNLEEPEADAAEDGRPRIAPRSVAFHPEGTTLNVMLGAHGRLLLPLQDSGLHHLLAGARGNVGVRGGRYAFEVVIVERRIPCDDLASEQRRPAVRVGFSAGGSHLLLGADRKGAGFDEAGDFVCGRERRKASSGFAPHDTVAVVLNVIGESAEGHSMSLFVNGIRASAPQLLPAELRGRPLHPAVAFRCASLRVNFGPSPLRRLPFRCRMVQDAAADDCEAVPQAKFDMDRRQEVLFPVALPDQGLFDWVDALVAKGAHAELSGRAVVNLAAGTGLERKRLARESRDRPDMSFGLPALDDLSAQDLVAVVSPALPRQYVVAEVRGNLLAEERKANLVRFPSALFKKIAVVLMGEPPQEFKDTIHTTMLEEKRTEAKKKGAVEVEFSEEEKQAWFRKHAVPDLTSQDLSKHFVNFSLPLKDEGFDEIAFAWQPEAKCQELFREWVLRHKLTQRAEDIEPGDWFKKKWSDWEKRYKAWKHKQAEWNEVLAQLKEWQKDDEKKDGDAEVETHESAEIDESIDPLTVKDINDVGEGKPLFAGFSSEDWSLLSLRYELHVLVHAFRRDAADPERTAFLELNLGFYYTRYFKRPFQRSAFGVESNARLVALVEDAIAIAKGPSQVLEARLPEDTPLDRFVRLAEQDRRDRLRRLDAGDETAALNFQKPQVGSAAANGARQGAGASRSVVTRPATSIQSSKRPGASEGWAVPASKVARPPPHATSRGAQGGGQGPHVMARGYQHGGRGGGWR